jgi:hypothetical protein
VQNLWCESSRILTVSTPSDTLVAASILNDSLLRSDTLRCAKSRFKGADAALSFGLRYHPVLSASFAFAASKAALKATSLGALNVGTGVDSRGSCP